MKFLPSWKMLIIYLEKFELFVWLFLPNLFFSIIHYTWFRKGWNTSIDINMIYIYKNKKWWFRYIYFVTNFIHAWTLFQSRFWRKKKKRKITFSREIYVTFENNFWKYFPVEKKEINKIFKKGYANVKQRKDLNDWNMNHDDWKRSVKTMLFRCQQQ